MVLGCPVLHRVDDELAHHWALARYVIATARSVRVGAVCIGSEEVSRHNLVLAEGIGVGNVIVNDVHVNAESVLVQRGYGLLQLGDATDRVGWVCRILTLRGVVVEGVVSPVEGSVGLVSARGKVKDRLQLNVSDS